MMMDGTIAKRVNEHVILCCISPEANDLLDTIMEEWDKHKANLPETLTCGDETWDPRESVYGFAYWLVRWSGLIEPAKQEGSKT